MGEYDDIIGYVYGKYLALTKNDYIEAISELMKNCNDIPLLDLVYKLFLKSI